MKISIKEKDMMEQYFTKIMMIYSRLGHLFRKFIFCMFCMGAFVVMAQQPITMLVAVNDTARTGPLQIVRKDVIYNDTVTDDTDVSLPAIQKTENRIHTKTNKKRCIKQEIK
jgi:hypothetical protein